jgi:outer membrane protein
MKTAPLFFSSIVLLSLGLVRGAERPELTLDDCVREALAANHAVLGRGAENDAAAARARAAVANRRPRLGVLGMAQHTTDALRVRPITANNLAGVFARDTWQVSGVASLPLYAGGRLVAEQEAARLLAEATAGDFAFVRQALALRVVAVFEDALALRAVIRSLDQSRATLGAQLERIDALLRQQKAAELDRLRVAVRLARVEQSAIETRSRLEISQATLAVLMGRDPAGSWELAGERPTPAAQGRGSATEVSERADETAALARAAAGKEQERAVRAAWLPSVDATAAWGPRSDFDGRESYDTGFAGVTFSWNVWDLGRTSARVAEARAVTRAREEAAAETSLQRRLDLANAEAGVRSAAARIDASRLAVEQSQESLRIEQRKYELGHGTITDVLDAQAAADEADSLRARALADHAIFLASRDFAAGHVFTRAAVTPALQADPGIGATNDSPSQP